MKPLPATRQNLPSTNRLCCFPQLAIVASLQANLRITGQVLDIQHPESQSLTAALADSDTDSLLAQLIIDRCRELSELLTCYQHSLMQPACLHGRDDFDLPF